MRSVLGICAALVAAPATVGAQAAIIDGVDAYGGVDPGAARAHLLRAVVAAGYSVRESATPCGPDRSCLRRRIAAGDADVAIRAAYVDLAGRIAVSLQLVDAAGVREVSATVTDLGAVDPDLFQALRADFDQPAAGGPRRAAWWLAGSSGALIIGGAAAVLVARDRRDRFFDEFVDDNGDVVGISPEAARRREQSANRWLAGGYALAAAGLVTGALSIALFATGEPGVAVRRSF